MGYTEHEFRKLDQEFARLDDLRRMRDLHRMRLAKRCIPCDKVVAVLGDDRVYPCKLEDGHAGRCEPDYDAGP